MRWEPQDHPADPNHPLHRASYALEGMKWGSEAWRTDNLALHAESAEGTDTWITRVFAAAELDVDPAALRAAVEHYALNYHNQTGLPLIACRSIFLDGLLHGVLFAAGVEADPPDYYTEEPQQ